MFHSKPFKKDLTPFAKGGKVVKHVGKGAKEQTRGPGGFESLTGNSMARMANSYPKAPAGPAPTESLGGPPMSSPVPQGSRPPGAPTAMMPPSGGGEEPDGDEAA
jgi:hypothetical protein